MTADLHIHTYFSDGSVSPEEVAAKAVENGVGIIAVTDHDTMLGVPRAEKACRERGVKLIRGIEVSAYENDIKLHTLGYNVDYGCAEYKSFAEELLCGSRKRAEDILYKLNENSVRLSISDVEAEMYDIHSPVHGMHIARAGTKKGYAENPFAFYSKYLSRGKRAFSLVGRPSPDRTVEVINACGGFASIAHPGRIDMEKEELFNLVRRLCGCGLRGIEGVYSAHTAKETAYYKEMAGALGLVVTGGSDTHYFGGNRKIGTPYFEPDAALLRLLN